ncbi:MAG: glycosyl hydrolase 115 family protein [Planctomycetes bacterium]|nr:glycosyl hydrolase 115 family protein [Planctomycetota bacterium]
MLGVVAQITAIAQVGEPPATGRFPLVTAREVADVLVDADDWKVARIAAGDLAQDVERVTGRLPAVRHAPDDRTACAVLIGTLGASTLVDGLVAAGRLDVADLRGQWESFVIEAIDEPMPGVARGLVIAGSDRRGTAYGVYELSRRIGVSPWYWWADVAPERRTELYVDPARVRVGPPAVRYRGIFINDEMWGIRPWAEGTLAPGEGRGLGPTTYARVFELLLRLRANHIWPAMHRGTIPFNYYPRNREVADDYAIVMGSSHIEPMLRNNMHGAEWDREGGGEWNYAVNREAILDYWERRIETNGHYENIYTIGMRGKDDEPMTGGATRGEQIALLERIFRDQREILARHVDPDPASIPQVFIPYTEVLGLYDAGLQVPDDVTICWPDDNFGYIRRLPTDAERRRSGGSGVYYHLQWLNGATTAYTWLNTTPPALIFAELTKAWQHGARRLWVLNVGDIKPGELGTELFLEMAWDPVRWRLDGVREFLVRWARRDLDPRFAEEIADLLEEHFRLGFARRPEHLVQSRGGQPLEFSWFSHEHYGDEAGLRLARYAAIARRAEEIYEQLPDARKDAFFELVLYPVRCAALMNEKVISADRSLRDAAAGRATAHEHAERARAAARQILELTERYDAGLLTAGDKWRYMMHWAPGPWGGQRHQFEMPPLSDFDGLGPPRLEVAPEGGRGGAVAELSVFTRGQRFIDLFNTGRGEIEWRARASVPWLLTEPPVGRFVTGRRLWVRVDWDAAPRGGQLDAAIEIESNAGSARVTVPVFAPAEPARDSLTGFVESHGCVSMEAEHFSRRRDGDGSAWQVIGGLGRCGDSVGVFPTTVASRSEPAAIRAHSPALDYEMHLFGTGDHVLHVDCLPTQPVAPGRGARVAISLDDGEPVILDEQARDVPSGVLANLRRWVAPLPIDEPGRHVLTLWMVDPGVIVDRIAVHTAAPPPSYLGPPESFRGRGAR